MARPAIVCLALFAVFAAVARWWLGPDPPAERSLVTIAGVCTSSPRAFDLPSLPHAPPRAQEEGPLRPLLLQALSLRPVLPPRSPGSWQEVGYQQPVGHASAETEVAGRARPRTVGLVPLEDTEEGVLVLREPSSGESEPSRAEPAPPDMLPQLEGTRPWGATAAPQEPTSSPDTFLPLPPPVLSTSPDAPSPLHSSAPPGGLSGSPPVSELAANRPLSPALEAVARQALAAAEQASRQGARGLLYTAAAELRQALWQLAQALDQEHGTDTHRQALTAALAALEHADEPSAAASALQQMTQAVGRVRAASALLERLGRVQALQAASFPSSEGATTRAMLLYRMALAIDPDNWQAANELGVLLARSGQWVEAREMLVHSVRIHPHFAGWHNLAVVHAQLGEQDLARRAAYERQLLLARTFPPPSRPGIPSVQWVDPRTFSAASDATPRVAVPPSPDAGSSSTWR